MKDTEDIESYKAAIRKLIITVFVLIVISVFCYLKSDKLTKQYNSLKTEYEEYKEEYLYTEGDLERSYEDGYSEAEYEYYDTRYEDGYDDGYNDAQEEFKQSQPLQPIYADGKTHDNLTKTYPMQKVESSFIDSIGYSDDDRILQIRFSTGGLYNYYNVEPYIYTAIMKADSKGSYFNEYIKGVYAYEKIAD